MGDPLKINPIIFLTILKKIYKIYRTFWYQVYPNRIENKVSVPDSVLSIRGEGAQPSGADQRFFQRYQFEIFTQLS